MMFPPAVDTDGVLTKIPAAQGTEIRSFLVDSATSPNGTRLPGEDPVGAI